MVHVTGLTPKFNNTSYHYFSSIREAGLLEQDNFQAVINVANVSEIWARRIIQSLLSVAFNLNQHYSLCRI